MNTDTVTINIKHRRYQKTLGRGKYV